MTKVNAQIDVGMYETVFYLLTILSISSAKQPICRFYCIVY